MPVLTEGLNPVDSKITAVAGVSFKPQHFQYVIDNKPAVGWFEVHPENYFMPGGPMLHYLGEIRRNYPVSFHSVGMSLGSDDGVCEAHFKKLKDLCERFEPAMVSDHLSWSRFNQSSLNDLLPLPYTQAALKRMIENVERAQTILGRKIALENPSSYFDLQSLNADKIELDECEFLICLAEISGADILLDVNNVFVSASNHGWDAKEYIERIPPRLVSEIHLAGHSIEETPVGNIRIDDHASRVCDQVWDLYQIAVQHVGRKPTLIEWDNDVPDFDVLQQEAVKADYFLNQA